MASTITTLSRIKPPLFTRLMAKMVSNPVWLRGPAWEEGRLSEKIPSSLLLLFLSRNISFSRSFVVVAKSPFVAPPQPQKNTLLSPTMSHLSEDEDDVSLASRARRKTPVSYLESDSDEDIPMSKHSKQSPNTSDTSVTSSNASKKTPKKSSKRPKIEDSSDDEEKVLPKKKAKKPATTKKKTAGSSSSTKVKKEPKVKKETKAKIEETKSSKKLKKEDSNDEPGEEGEEDEYKWWENEDMNDEIKWNTLEHNGVMFPPAYEALPKKVKLIYDGQPVVLPLEAEEVAGFFGAMVETDHAKNPVFQKNFFRDFLEVLDAAGGTKNGIKIKDFAKCDWSKIYQHYEEKKEQRKALSSAEKKEIKLKKDEEEAPFKFCMFNGRKEQVGNFRVEPPGLFRGRGSHPKTGTLKKRIYPEDITINIGKEAKIPEPPAAHKWAEVRHDNTGGWLAMWKENVLGGTKYVRLAANSSLKGMSDFKKFEKARELKNHIEVIRRDYYVNLSSKMMYDRQLATATYLIDVLALRAGGEKGDDEADTVGCCSLRYEHITLQPPNTVIFDFLGKDSIRFYQEKEVDKQVFKNLKIFKKPPKGVGDQLFDRIEPSLLNKHLQNYMPGLTAKVFRTYNASKTMQDLLKNIPNEGSINEKLVKFNAANREVAILCNHQRSVTKGHAASVAKIDDKINEMRWQKLRLKKIMLMVDSKLKKKLGADYFAEIGSIDEPTQNTIIEMYIDREKDRLTKKFHRDNDRLKMEEKPTKPPSELKEVMQKYDKLRTMYLKEAKTGKIAKSEIEDKNHDVEKLQKQVTKIEERIATTSLQLKDKKDNATVSLGTSKINYIDPRLSVMFSKKYNVPIEKLFTKTLRDKFKWAIESADENWEF
ncbi:DNA topoisomerase 1 [Saccharomycopsis crataegensis]|uniref:DNA topoisomerase I n=1 Tax=Saccharomycopsis crataegensis TaxID=43959 RepID=A0AAV5QIL9_9ASCO|nr:DNA topoisomerase 1 [Saccharomycopsis crataegensis]